ncbi:EAL domain-containing protein [Sulfurimonas sp.]
MTNAEIKKVTISAIENSDIVPYFQPIIREGGEIKYETLARIKSFPALSPRVFIPLIFHTPYYEKLTKIIIDKTFKYFSGINIDFSINLDAKLLADDTFFPYLKNKIDEYGVGNNLIIEILEYRIDKLGELCFKARELNELSVRIALDDFGSGHSNYTTLIALNPQIIKIDGNIVKNVLTSKKKRTIITHLINLSRDLGIRLVAESVENEEIYNYLKEIGIKIFQGYYIGIPNNNLEIKKQREK